jgi:hypothetical protein
VRASRPLIALYVWDQPVLTANVWDWRSCHILNGTCGVAGHVAILVWAKEDVAKD